MAHKYISSIYLIYILEIIYFLNNFGVAFFVFLKSWRFLLNFFKFYRSFDIFIFLWNVYIIVTNLNFCNNAIVFIFVGYLLSQSLYRYSHCRGICSFCQGCGSFSLSHSLFLCSHAQMQFNLYKKSQIHILQRIQFI